MVDQEERFQQEQPRQTTAEKVRQAEALTRAARQTRVSRPPVRDAEPPREDARGRRREPESNIVVLDTGEATTREFFESLTPAEQRLLNEVGPARFDAIRFQQFGIQRSEEIGAGADATEQDAAQTTGSRFIELMRELSPIRPLEEGRAPTQDEINALAPSIEAMLSGRGIAHTPEDTRRIAEDLLQPRSAASQTFTDVLRLIESLTPVVGTIKAVDATLDNWQEASVARRSFDVGVSTLSAVGDVVIVGVGAKTLIKGVASGGGKIISRTAIVNRADDAAPLLQSAASQGQRPSLVLDGLQSAEDLAQAEVLLNRIANNPALASRIEGVTLRASASPSGAESLIKMDDAIQAASSAFPSLRNLSRGVDAEFIVTKSVTASDASDMARVLSNSNVRRVTIKTEVRRPPTTAELRQSAQAISERDGIPFEQAFDDVSKQFKGTSTTSNLDLEEAARRIAKQDPNRTLDQVRADLRDSFSVDPADIEQSARRIRDEFQRRGITVNFEKTTIAPILPGEEINAVSRNVVLQPEPGTPVRIMQPTLTGPQEPLGELSGSLKSAGFGRVDVSTGAIIPTDSATGAGAFALQGSTIFITDIPDVATDEPHIASPLVSPPQPTPLVAPFDPLAPITITTQFPVISTPQPRIGGEPQPETTTTIRDEPSGEPTDLPGEGTERTTPPEETPDGDTSTDPEIDTPTVTDPTPPGAPFGGTFTPPFFTPTFSPFIGPGPAPEPTLQQQPQPTPTQTPVIPGAPPRLPITPRRFRRPPRPGFEGEEQEFGETRLDTQEPVAWRQGGRVWTVVSPPYGATSFAFPNVRPIGARVFRDAKAAFDFLQARGVRFDAGALERWAQFFEAQGGFNETESVEAIRESVALEQDIQSETTGFIDADTVSAIESEQRQLAAHNQMDDSAIDTELSALSMERTQIEGLISDENRRGGFKETRRGFKFPISFGRAGQKPVTPSVQEVDF